ncbi:hypothetical protein SAMN06264346_105146 [Chryseobacterium profundimaris]|uniref:Uncharacterized protein n=2 Tax=Chryseobacterium profundimaris TaxID=1387275 RepID=A0ABY1NW56_9FLAO|nr:hypothetical protein SAMN06264346_105146 [Chryseobacterium profundimaris]
MSINVIYESVVISAFLYSIYLLIFKRFAKQQSYLYIYLLVVIMVDIIPVNYSDSFPINRNTLFLAYILFSLLYFGSIYHIKIKSGRFRFLNLALVISLLILNIYGNTFDNDGRINFIAIVSLPMLFLYESISWYLFKLENIDENKIMDDLFFWISSGILTWSVFFIFRAIPMYFLQDNDPQLLNLVITAFSVVNTIMYILFLIGLIFIKDERTSRRN